MYSYIIWHYLFSSLHLLMSAAVALTNTLAVFLRTVNSSKEITMEQVMQSRNVGGHACFLVHVKLRSKTTTINPVKVHNSVTKIIYLPSNRRPFTTVLKLLKHGSFSFLTRHTTLAAFILVPRPSRGGMGRSRGSFGYEAIAAF